MAPASGYGSFPGQTYTPPGSGPIPSFNGGGRGGGHMGGYEQQQNHYQPGPAARKQCQFKQICGAATFLGGSGRPRCLSRLWIQAKKGPAPVT